MEEINNTTGQICKDSGADVLVAGSYIFSQEEENYKNIMDILDNGLG